MFVCLCVRARAARISPSDAASITRRLLLFRFHGLSGLSPTLALVCLEIVSLSAVLSRFIPAIKSESQCAHRPEFIPTQQSDYTLVTFSSLTLVPPSAAAGFVYAPTPEDPDMVMCLACEVSV